MIKKWINKPEAFLFFGVLIAYCYFYQGTEDHIRAQIALARSLAETGHVIVDPYAETTIDLAFHDGHYYSPKAPAYSFIAAPFWKIFRFFTDDENLIRVFTIFLTSSLPGALCGVFMFGLFRKFGVPKTQSYLFAIVFSLGTPLFSYSTLFLQTPLLVLSLISVIYFLSDSSLSKKNISAAGFFAGLAVANEFAVLFLILPFFVYLFLKNKDWVDPFLFGIWMLPFLSLILFYNYLCFGNPLILGNFKLIQPQFQSQMGSFFNRIFIPNPEALWTLMFSIQKGLFIYCPFLLAGIFGFVTLLEKNKNRKFFISIAAGFIWLTLFVTSIPNWYGGLLSGPRYLIAGLPFIAIGLIGISKFINASKKPMAIFLLIASVWSVFYWLIITSVGPFAPIEMANPLQNRFLHSLMADEFVRNFGNQILMLPHPISLLPLIAGSGFFLFKGWKILRR